MNTEERRKYFKSLNKYRTNLSVMEYATEEGLEKGLEKGREEGERKKAIEIARNLKTLNVPIDTIVKSTGLSVSEIESL